MLKLKHFLWILLFIASGCSVGEIQEVGTVVANFYLTFLFSVVLITSIGLIIWQRNHPYIKQFLNPINQFISGKLITNDKFHFESSYTREEEIHLKKAKLILNEIENILTNDSKIAEDKKRRIREQSHGVIRNMVQLLDRIARIRKLSLNMSGSKRNELEKMDFSLQMQLERSLEILENLPINLMKVEMTSADLNIDRLISNLDETNSTMLDLAESYDALRRLSK